MTDKEKMLSERYYYHSSDSELAQERVSLYQRVLLYNTTNFAGDTGRQNAALRSIIPNVADDVFVQPPFYVDYGYNVTLGKGFYSNYNCVFIDSGKITIGDYVKFGPNVNVYTAEHPVNPDLRKAQYETVRNVTIGDNVWIGGGTIILPGVTIGNNVVIGGGSVVKKDIPDNSIAVGNPCRVIGDVRQWKEKENIILNT